MASISVMVWLFVDKILQLWRASCTAKKKKKKEEERKKNIKVFSSHTSERLYKKGIVFLETPEFLSKVVVSTRSTSKENNILCHRWPPLMFCPQLHNTQKSWLKKTDCPFKIRSSLLLICRMGCQLTKQQMYILISSFSLLSMNILKP